MERKMENQSARQLSCHPINFLGWNAYEIGNGLIRLVAVPDIGGRIMAYDLGPYAYLYIDPDLAGKLFSRQENQGDGSLAAWKNYGGDKTWPSPQGWDNDEQWAGPPDSILDTGRYQLDEFNAGSDSATIKMTSPEGSPTGVQITRQATIYAGSTRVTLDLSFRNLSQRKIRWSIWDVVQLQAGRKAEEGKLVPETACVVTAPLNPHSQFEAGYDVMFGDQHNPQWQADRQAGLFIGNYQWEIGKVGLDSRAGWAAFANKAAQQAFTVRYTACPDQEYPDHGAAVEFWTVGRGRVANLDYEQSQIYLMEVEILSPFQLIEPGQEASFRIEWGACRCPGPILEVTEGGCVGRRLLAQRNGDYVHLTGAFGVFDQGVLELEWLDPAGKILETITLEAVSPIGVISLDHIIPFLNEAAQVQLTVITNSTQVVLASTSIS
jgi:hypothetical protein